VEIDLDPDPSSPAPIGDLSIVYSLNGGPWTPLQSVSSFPVTITLPSLTPGIYTGNLRIAVRATDSSPCNLPSAISDRPISINLTDRPGNRFDNPITIDLDETSPGSGIWTATISDNTSGPGLSDEYTGLPRAQAAQDLFFRIELPACLDSLDISLCGTTGTLTDSYIHLINVTAEDTIDSDDGCSTGSLSRIVAINKPNVNTRNADPSSQPARDSLLLVRGHILYLVVEGNGSATGTFTINITGYERSSPQAPEIVLTPTYPPLAGSNYLWGQQVEIDLDPDPSSPAPIGDLSIVYSLNGGPWTPLQSVSSFPVTITLPSLTPGIYTGNLRIAVRATDPTPCNLPSDISDRPVSINLTDRPGNRVDNAITIDLDETPTGSGIWTATISDSTDGLAISDEYTGLPRAQAARDLFFRIQLPACLDSLDISLCGSTGTLTDSYIHLINATAGDTIDSDNGCSTGSLSRIVAIGTPNANTRNADPSSQPARDSLLLVRGHTLYLVVEGNGSATGKFTVNITGYKRRPSSINVAGVPSGPVCVRSNPITLNATTPGATAYQWLDANGNPIQQATSATYTVNPNAEGRITVSVLAVFNPNNAPSCLTRADSVTSQPVTITVEDTARAQIADANDRPVSNQTLSITAGSNVNLRVRSPQNSGNTYTWKRYNGIPPSGTPATSSGNNLTITNISAGRYTVILEAVRGTGACGTTRDTVYLDVTTGLRTDAGTFSIFPNPNTGAFTIVAPAMDTYHIHVLDVAGRLVAEDTFTGSTHQMRLSLPAGVYQIRLVAGDKAQIGRLIITE